MARLHVGFLNYAAAKLGILATKLASCYWPTTTIRSEDENTRGGTHVSVCGCEVHAWQVIEILVLAEVSRYMLERPFVDVFVCVNMCVLRI